MKNLDESWKRSRHGAWAGRGFHYQHLFTVLILVRQWAGLAPPGLIVPEGQEDCVIEFPDHSLWLQIKSRKEGSFSGSEFDSVLSEARKKAVALDGDSNVRLAIGLERKCEGQPEYLIDSLFDQDTGGPIVCAEPDLDAFAALAEQVNTADVILHGLLNDIYKLVAESAAANAAMDYEHRRRISGTDIERLIFERLEAEDPSAIDQALLSGVIAPLDLGTETPEEAFYQGVKTRPGHVAAGLVLDRPDETGKIADSLLETRQALITGPSGAGKSALLWLVINHLAAGFRWFEITPRAGVPDAEAILKFLRSRRPAQSFPIGLVMDDIGSDQSALWNVLVHEARGLPSLYLIGTMRNEDLTLLTRRSDAAVFNAGLTEALATHLWEQLRAKGQSSWEHWHEPYELSEGLLLEYVHLLTQGERLGLVIADQVRRRETEDRLDELAIIRASSVLCAMDAELDAQGLLGVLGITPENGSKALKRLLEEHLVRESKPGILGGLHTLRSEALSAASHDEAIYCREHSLWQAIESVTPETMPRLVHALLRIHDAETGKDVLQHLADLLVKHPTLEVWLSVLTGLGLATLEKRARSFVETLERHEIPRGFWMLASMFGDVEIKIPEFEGREQWEAIRAAILEFRAEPKNDLRHACIELMPEGPVVPQCTNLREANSFLACLVPILGGEPLRITIRPHFSGKCEQDIREVAPLLSTAYFMGADVAQDLAAALGGEDVLLSWFKNQTPWLADPLVEEAGKHGHTVRADWYYIAEDHQPDPHDTVCGICETLIALSPSSQAAACDVIDPMGQPITINGMQPWSKNMPRGNLPSKPRIAWNVAFRQIVMSRAAEAGLTAYASTMADLTVRTEKAFRRFSEKWISGRRIGIADALTAEINDINEKANRLAYASSQEIASSMEAPEHREIEDDAVGSLFTGVLGNLAPRLVEAAERKGAKGAAAFAGSLSAQALGYRESAIWRAAHAPPRSELKALAQRLGDISNILHELDCDSSPAALQPLVKAARKARIDRAAGAVARRCHSRGEARFSDLLASLKNALASHHFEAEIISRRLSEPDCVYWPPREVAILVHIDDFETDADALPTALEEGKRLLGDQYPFRIAPVLRGHVIAGLAMLPSSGKALPDLDFAANWAAHLPLPLFRPKVSGAFDRAMTACCQISGIMYCRDLQILLEAESGAIDDACRTFEECFGLVNDAWESTRNDVIGEAADYLQKTWHRVCEEQEIAKRDEKPGSPVCSIPYKSLSGEVNDDTMNLTVLKLLLCQAECELISAQDEI